MVNGVPCQMESLYLGVRRARLLLVRPCSALWHVRTIHCPLSVVRGGVAFLPRWIR